jgi:glycosyltransferase involved in cell wall biosynthesis
MTPSPELSIVVPVYRSAACLRPLLDAIDEALAAWGRSYEVVLVNDGSPDESWAVIETLCRERAHVVGVDLRRNFGQDNAILAGMRLVRGRWVAIMDDDLQHDPRHLPDMVAELERGTDIVYAAFTRQRQRAWKRLGSWFNGKVAQWVIDKPPHIYLSPYKAIRREVADLAARYEGPEPYLDGLLLQVTSRLAQITVDHRPRYQGRSNFTFRRSLGVWARLAFSFSVRPLRLVTWFGCTLAALGGLLAVGFALERVYYPEHFSAGGFGWASLMVAQLVIGGVQMVFFGILGEYAGRTFLRVNRAPQATIRQVLNRAPGDAPSS